MADFKSAPISPILFSSSESLSGMSSSPSSRDLNPSTFYRDELERALGEQTFGIKSFALENATTRDARARVTLLEGVKVDIILSIAGYQARASSSSVAFNESRDEASVQATDAETPPSQSTVIDSPFETIDILLEHISPKYVEKRADILIARLTA